MASRNARYSYPGLTLIPRLPRPGRAHSRGRRRGRGPRRRRRAAPVERERRADSCAGDRLVDRTGPERSLGIAAMSPRTRQPSTVRLSLIPSPFPTFPKGTSAPAVPITPLLPLTLAADDGAPRAPTILVRAEMASALRHSAGSATEAVPPSRARHRSRFSRLFASSQARRAGDGSVSAVPLDALDRVVGHDAKSRLEPRPVRSRHPLARMDRGVAESLEVGQQPAVVETERHCGLVYRATDDLGDALPRHDQLALAIGRRKPSPWAVIHPVRADRHSMAAELAQSIRIEAAT